MNNSALVSIVLTTYNGEKYLATQLDSILNQSYKNIELIICDDCSTDTTATIIKAFAEKYKNISSYFNAQNIGVNKNFENGFQIAKGEFIAIADQDDIWVSTKIKEQMELFYNDVVVLTHSCSILFSGNNLPSKTHKTITKLFEGNDIRKLLLRNSVSGHNIIFRKSLLPKALPIPDKIYYDWWLVQTAACNGIVKATNRVLAYQRAHETNITVKKRKTPNQTFKEYEERKIALKAFTKLNGLKQNCKKFIEETLVNFTLLENKKFSKTLYAFLMQNRNTFFFYKKGVLKYFSQIKAAKQMCNKVVN